MTHIMNHNEHSVGLETQYFCDQPIGIRQYVIREDMKMR